MTNTNPIQWHVCHSKLSHVVGSPHRVVKKKCAVSVPYASICYALNRAFSLLLKSTSVRAYSGDK